jgi:uracil-DNA glycosylase
MMTDAEHAARNQQMLALALGLAAARALVRNRIIVVVGLAAVAIVAHRKGTAMSASLRSWAAANMAAWRPAKRTD